MEKEKNLRHRTHLVASKEGNNDLDEPPKVGLTTRMTSLRRLVTGQTVLFKFPILALVAVASLDNADKQLLASSFPMLEKTLGLDVCIIFSFCCSVYVSASRDFKYLS